MRKRSSFLAVAVLVVAGGSGEIMRRACMQSYLGGFTYWAIARFGTMTSEWEKTFICSAGDTLSCNWCMRQTVDVWTTAGWIPASFVDHVGGNSHSDTVGVACDRTYAADQVVGWGGISLPANYLHYVRVTYTLYDGTCTNPGAQLLQVYLTGAYL